jgi:hypothetical protein
MDPTRQCHQGEVGAQRGESWAALALKTAQPRFLEVAGRRVWKKMKWAAEEWSWPKRRSSLIFSFFPFHSIFLLFESQAKFKFKFKLGGSSFANYICVVKVMSLRVFI